VLTSPGPCNPSGKEAAHDEPIPDPSPDRPMSRDDGFAIADVDTGLMHDRKILALARYLHDDGLTSIALVMYESLFLMSWGEGQRLTLEETQPAWLNAGIAGVREALERVGLIDAEARVPESSWEAWFGVARDRRERRREAGSLGGRTRVANLQSSSSNAQPSLEQRSSTRATDRNGTDRNLTDEEPPARVREDGDENGDAPTDPADSYWTLTGKYPNDKARAWIDQLTEQYGAMAVVRGLAACHIENPEVRTLLGRTGDRLARDERQQGLAARESGRKRAAAQPPRDREAEYRAQKATLAKLMAMTPDELKAEAMANGGTE